MTAMRSPASLFICSSIVALVVLMMPGCGTESASQDGAMGPGEGVAVSATSYALSDTARAGEELFNANCSACHGANAAGTDQGPTLIDRIYHPNHHADFSFLSAVSRGVRQHHWRYGDMPAVPGVSPDDAAKIICYVRQVQRANGIFDEDAYSIAC